jgi:hypothetical protein
MDEFNLNDAAVRAALRGVAAAGADGRLLRAEH